MKFNLKKINHLTGNQASIYTLYHKDTNKNLFENFLTENINLFKSEIIDITKRLKTIGYKTGASEHFFKLEEGKPGDGVCALYDNPESNLRLYCIRYGKSIIIVGGGGHKPKNIKALQESPKLAEEQELMKTLSAEITLRLTNKDIEYTENYMEFEGNLEFTL